MNRPPVEVEPRRAFSKTQRHEILLRQAIKGADEVFVAKCDVCASDIAFLSAEGKWIRLRPFDFDHILARILGGQTVTDNGRAICSPPESCHLAKSAEDVKRWSKAEAQGGRTGQYARRLERKAKGLPSAFGRRK